MASEEPEKYLQEKRKALKDVEDHIATLEKELATARRTRESILSDLAVFHNAAHSPIAKLPPEILLFVFEQCDEAVDVRNRTLCLVCKRWYNLVSSSGSLWSTVLIRPNRRVNSLDSLFRFVKQCHQRTGNKPVDVILDISTLPRYAELITLILNENMKPISAFLSRDLIFDPVDWRNEQTLGHPFGALYEQLSWRIMESLIEQNLAHVNRWKSLKIEVGWREDVVPMILGLLTEDMKNMCEISIHRNLRTNNLFFGMPIVVPPFLELRRFSTNLNVCFHTASPSPSILEHLVLDNRDATILFLSDAPPDLPALVALSLMFGEELDPTLFIPSLNLPKLRFLKLSGRESQDAVVKFNAPSLEQKGPLEPFRASIFTTITTLAVHGYGPTVPPLTGEIVVSTRALKAVLQQCSLLVSLRLYKDFWGGSDEVMRAILEVRQEGYSLRHLREVIIVNPPWSYPRGDPYFDFLTEDRRYITVLQVPAYPSMEFNNSICEWDSPSGRVENYGQEDMDL